ncbi:MAG TPA: chemotaxis protein CheW [Kofleriaceae bacterium]|jgi:purine-binding chemotaxis protein CheW|nr:chemotaxis protein CheW [Kofleriaceae bacterium]
MSLHVGFRVGTTDYALPAADVLHLDTFDAATPVPGAPAYVAGLVQTRGKLVPVVDLRARFGLAPAERTLDSRIVVVRVGARIAGLLVDSAREVMQIDEAACEQPPDVFRARTNEFVKAVATVTKRLVLVVDVPRIIGEEHSDG